MTREEIINLIVKVVVMVIAALIGRYLIPLIRTSVGADKLSLIKQWALVFVKAAENIIKGEKKGNEKCELVTSWISEKANEIGITMSADDVRSVLEDAYTTMVEESKNGQDNK